MLRMFSKYRETIKNELEIDIDMISKNNSFDKDTYINLKDFLLDRKLNNTEILTIITRVSNIFQYIEKNGYIVGSISISDFWIKNNDLSKLTYKINRRLLKTNDTLLNYQKGEICAPEIIKNDSKNIDKNTDVFVLGKLTLALIFNNRMNIEGYSQERYISYNLNLFDIDLPLELHSFLGKSTCLLKESRFDSIKSCNENLKKIIDNNDKRLLDKSKKLKKIEYSSKTHVGDGKLKIHRSKGKKDDFANEDIHLFLKQDNKIFFVVADGVTNSRYGTGYEASNIVKNMSEYLWEKSKYAINTQSDIEKFYNVLVNLCNERIFKSIFKDTNIENISNKDKIIGDIMATTFSSGIIIDDELYYTSLGDSPIYILSNENNLALLTEDDNIGNKILKNSMRWVDYQDISSRSSLTNYIGKAEIVDGILKPSKIEISIKRHKLLEGDILIACSDGLTDYVSGVGRSDDIWMTDEYIENVFINNRNRTLDEINDILIESTNNNGGMDNITSILIKLYFNK